MMTATRNRAPAAMTIATTQIAASEMTRVAATLKKENVLRHHSTTEAINAEHPTTSAINTDHSIASHRLKIATRNRVPVATKTSVFYHLKTATRNQVPVVMETVHVKEGA